jgi:hypothetical protein
MNQKIPVVYILSNGRSGTTLLDMLLGAHPNIWTLGEAQILPWELINSRVPCGCGQPVSESEFWKPILDLIPTEINGYHIGYFRNINQVGKVIRWDLLFDLLRGRAREKWKGPIDEYGRKNAKLFEVVRKAAEQRSGHEIRWLVDASKDPYRLFWLKQSGYFDLRIIHVIKDPRALVFSMAKPWLPYGAHRVVRYTGRWIVENMIMHCLYESCFQTVQVWRQTYETLASQPGKTLQAIGEWLDVRYPPERVAKFRDYENFAISGNMMRWRENDDKIRLDQRWKNQLPSVYEKFVHLVTRPFQVYCGYAEAW